MRPGTSRSWIRAGSVLAVIAILPGLLAGCDSEDSSEGPGPVGPVGPQEPVGPVGEDDQGIPGSGTITSQTRDVADFDRIRFGSEGRVTVAHGDAASLTIAVDDNLQQFLETSVSGGVLDIATAEGIDIAPTEPPEFRILATSILGIDLDGAGSIDVDAVGEDRFAVGLAGAGDITIRSVTVGELTLALTGVGSVTIAGTADRQDATVAGMGTYDAAELESRHADIAAAGTGVATVWVSETLDANAADSGSISYFGEPTVTQDVSDLGAVNPLGPKQP